MAWQDDPVAQPAWMSDPVASAAPEAGPPATLAGSTSLAGASRALEANLPFVDRAVAAAKTYLPGGNGQDYAANLAAEQAKNAQFAQQNPWTNAVGGLTAAAPLAALPIGGGSLASQAASLAKLGAAGGAVAGASGSPDLTNIPDTATRAGIGAGTGAALGAAAPYAAFGIGKAITPFAPDANRQAMAAALRGADVPLTAGQTVGSPMLQSLEREGIGAGAFTANQNKAFTKALMDKAGLSASDATQPSIAAVKADIGAKFDALGERNAVAADDGLRSGVLDAVANYQRLGGTSPGVETAANDLLYQNEPIAGDAYTAMRSRLGKDAQSLSKSDPPQAQAYRDIQGALDDAMDRSIAANNPGDLGAFREARRQYGNFLDISKSASKLTGENAVAGTIPPSRMQTVLSSGNRAPGYAAGQGDLAELTRAGVGMLQPPPSSAMSALTRNALAHALVSGTVGGAYGGYTGGPGGALAGAIGGAFLPTAAGTALRMPMVQSYLQNQVAPGIGLNRAALAAGLAARPLLQSKGGSQ